MASQIKIGIVATSSKIPRIELKMGVERIRNSGFGVRVHPSTSKSFLFFAGTDEQRARAFFEYAKNPELSVIWCARGGYGVVRLLPLLEEYSKNEGVPPKKLLVGFSDITGLMEFVRTKWGWQTLHGPMPSMRKFSILEDSIWNPMTHWLAHEKAPLSWGKKRFTFWTPPPAQAIEAPVVGGNLTVWNSLIGTRFEGNSDGCILFLEDVDEGLYRIDRMLQQLLLAGKLNRVKAIVLGNFLNCRDGSPQVLKALPSPKNKARVLQSPKPAELKPLRLPMKELRVLKSLFSEVGQRLGIPVLFGLPVGHGPEVHALPLGATYRISPQGEVEMVRWDWLKP